MLSGEDESRLTFLAARRWFGWSSGRLLVIDIGGGSLELAAGLDEEPDARAAACRSAPDGSPAPRCRPQDPPDRAEVRALRKQVRADIARVVRDLTKVRCPRPRRGHEQDAAVAGPDRRGRAQLRGPATSRGPSRWRTSATWSAGSRRMTVRQRATLPGVSPGRARQLLAGAVVAEAAMDLLGVDRLDICPWALREGVILRRLEWICPLLTRAGRAGAVRADG